MESSRQKISISGYERDCFDDNENVFLMFYYIEGETVGKTLTYSQLSKAAEIMACLHSYDSDIPVFTEKIQ